MNVTGEWHHFWNTALLRDLQRDFTHISTSSRVQLHLLFMKNKRQLSNLSSRRKLALKNMGNGRTHAGAPALLCLISPPRWYACLRQIYHSRENRNNFCWTVAWISRASQMMHRSHAVGINWVYHGFPSHTFRYFTLTWKYSVVLH